MKFADSDYENLVYRFEINQYLHPWPTHEVEMTDYTGEKSILRFGGSHGTRSGTYIFFKDSRIQEYFITTSLNEFIK